MSYYTVLREGEEKSEVEKFFEKFTEDEEHREDIQELRAFIVELGEKIGAKDRYFRFEEVAEALPPKFIGMDIRLYCYRLSEQIVILFNGGVKTTAKAQDCPNVAPHFRFANRVSHSIERLKREGMIDATGKTILNADEILLDF